MSDLKRQSLSLSTSLPGTVFLPTRLGGHAGQGKDLLAAVPPHWLCCFITVTYCTFWTIIGLYLKLTAKTATLLRLLLLPLLGYSWDFYMILSKVFASYYFMWYFCMHEYGSLSHPSAPPRVLQTNSFLPAQVSLCLCDGFCNECSLMCRRSRVKQSA